MTHPDKSDFVVVANRLPVDRVVDADGNESWRTSPGGLVTALEPVLRRHGGAWIGWQGSPDEVLEPFENDGIQLVPVPLSADDVELYYEGFSNATLWPLYHDTVAFPEFHRHWWLAYDAVNRRFAEAAADVAAEGATVWVQDYQLQLVPAMLRAMRPDLRIGFFLHIPFPPAEIFAQLPWRRHILEGLLGADIVGFQVPSGAENFRRLVASKLGFAAQGDDVLLPDRRVTARAYPISIDSAAFRELAETEEVRARAAELRQELGNPETVYLGVDRLDYTKGIRHRINAFGELFIGGELDPSEAVFVQVASPSRERVGEYMRLRDDIELLVGRLNGAAGVIGRPPIVYLHHSYPRTEMAALYLVADVMVVTPLRDGMNLVAKEYLAARPDGSGALVLSEFAGAAWELGDAYQVNPYDTDGMKQALLVARDDDPTAREMRMRALQEAVFNHDIDKWASSFLDDLAQSRGRVAAWNTPSTS